MKTCRALVEVRRGFLRPCCRPLPCSDHPRMTYQALIEDRADLLAAAKIGQWALKRVEQLEATLRKLGHEL